MKSKFTTALLSHKRKTQSSLDALMQSLTFAQYSENRIKCCHLIKFSNYVGSQNVVTSLIKTIQSCAKLVRKIDKKGEIVNMPIILSNPHYLKC